LNRITRAGNCEEKRKDRAGRGGAEEIDDELDRTIEPDRGAEDDAERNADDAGIENRQCRSLDRPEEIEQQLAAAHALPDGNEHGPGRRQQDMVHDLHPEGDLPDQQQN